MIRGHRLLAVLVLFLCGAGCEAPGRLTADAYVWNRRWTPAVRDALAQRPTALRAIRVLVGEIARVESASRQLADWIDVDAASLLGGPVVAVLRVNGALPDDATWLAFLARTEALRHAGVDVRQVELDYDATQDALPEYLAWLEATCGTSRLARSVTALPAWARSPAALSLARIVDEVVLQVHTIRAPVLFDAEAAVRDAKQWAEASGRPFRVALPTYRARLASGEDLAAVPAEVARSMKALAALPQVTGFVFFRLGNADDRQSWSLATLDAVLTRSSLAAEVRVRLAPIDVAGSDVWLDNQGSVDALAPAALALGGELDEAIATTGYQHLDGRFVTLHPLWLRPGEHLRVGTIRGRNLHVMP